MDAKDLSMHEFLMNNFTEEQLRIMLIEALGNICNKDYYKMGKSLGEYYVIFNMTR